MISNRFDAAGDLGALICADVEVIGLGVLGTRLRLARPRPLRPRRWSCSAWPISWLLIVGQVEPARAPVSRVLAGVDVGGLTPPGGDAPVAHRGRIPGVRLGGGAGPGTTDALLEDPTMGKETGTRTRSRGRPGEMGRARCQSDGSELRRDDAPRLLEPCHERRHPHRPPHPRSRAATRNRRGHPHDHVPAGPEPTEEGRAHQAAVFVTSSPRAPTPSDRCPSDDRTRGRRHGPPRITATGKPTMTGRGRSTRSSPRRLTGCGPGSRRATRPPGC